MKKRGRTIFVSALVFIFLALSGCGSQGKIIWKVSPLLSSSYPYLPLDFNFHWDRIELSCTDGELYGSGAVPGAIIPKGKSADFEAYQNPVLWSCFKNNQPLTPENVVKKAELRFRIYKGEELLHEGSIRIRRKKTNQMFYTYEAVLRCGTLWLSAGGKEEDGKNQVGVIRQASGEK